MHHRSLVLCAACGLLVAGASCRSKTEPPTADGSAAEPGAEARGILLPEGGGSGLEIRESLAGRWVLSVAQLREGEGFADYRTAVVDFAPQGGGRYSAEVLGSTSHLPDARLASADVVDRSVVGRSDEPAPREEDVHIVLRYAEGEVDFRGSLRGGAVYGSVWYGDRRLDAASLVAVEEFDLEALERAAPRPEAAELDSAVRSANPFAALRSFCQSNPDSPVALQVYENLTGHLGEQKFDEAAVRAFRAESMEAARRWGARMGRVAACHFAVRLAASLHLPDLAAEALDSARAGLDGPLLRAWEPELSAALRHARLAQALRSIEDGDRAGGERLLAELRESDPFDPVTLWTLAAYWEQMAKEPGRALPLYADLVAGPMLQPLLLADERVRASLREAPAATLVRLWEQEHGDTKGLDAYLDEAYASAMRRVEDSAAPPPADKSGGRVSVVEVFTGAMCETCVAAEAAATAARSAYRGHGVIVLCYHQHGPGADPLASPAAERRRAFYDSRAVPSLLANGDPVDDVGGLMTEAAAVYRRLRERIDPTLPEAAPLELSAGGEVRDGVLSVRAAAEGKGSGDLRLIVLLAQDGMRLQAPTGIVRHDMVVRWAFGPDGGAELGAGSVVAEEVPLDEIARQLREDLSRAARGQELSIPPLDPSKLYVVALVQNVATKRVLHAAFGRVDGGDPVESEAVEAPIPTSRP